MAWLLALDRGNNSIKIALFDSDTIIGRWRAPLARAAKTLRGISLEVARDAMDSGTRQVREADRRRLSRVLSESTAFHSVVFSSVSPRWTREIRRVLAEMEVSRILEVKAGIEFPFDILVDRPAKVGPDRLAAAAGVVAAGGREGVIVDAGTAITVDILTKKGFLGGSVFPGDGLSYRALHEGTALLPLTSDDGRAIEPPGRNTEEAVISGVRWGTVGAVKELVRRSRRRVSKNALVWVTGGGSAELKRHLGESARYEPDLVFLGLNHLFRLNCG